MTTDTGAALLAIVRANPADWDARRVYADWLDDGSEEGAILAAGQRWQAWKRKYPQLWFGVLSGSKYVWWRNRHRKPNEHRLGDMAFKQLIRIGLADGSLVPRQSETVEQTLNNSLGFLYPNAAEAESTLARALWVLGIQAT